MSDDSAGRPRRPSRCITEPIGDSRMTEGDAARDARKQTIEDCKKVCDQFAEARQAMKEGADEDEIEEFQLQIIAARMIRRRIEALARLDPETQ